MHENPSKSLNVVDMYKNYPATVIKEITGLTFHRIYSTLRQEGVEIKPRGRRPMLINPGREFIENLMETYRLSQSEAGVVLNVSKRTIQRWLKK